MKRLTITLLCLLTVPVVRAEVPVTDREQTLAFSAAELNTLAGKTYAKTLHTLKEKKELDGNALLLRKTRTIAGRLIAQAIKLKPQAASWKWELHLTSSKDVDAYSMAGGKLLFSTHFIRDNHFTDDELAILIGHEIGHAIAEHVREQATAVLLSNPKNPDRSLNDVLAEMNSNLAVYFQLMPMSRMQEIEADQIGVRLAAMAGFQPTAALSFYKKLASDEDAGRGSLFDSHDPPWVRRRIAPALVADSKRFYQKALFASSSQVYTLR